MSRVRPLAAVAPLAAIAAALLLAACSGTQVPQDTFYRVTADGAQAGPAAVSGTLQVMPVVAAGLVAERPILHASATDPGALHQYHYHFWAQTPPEMLQQELVSYLRAAGVAERVVGPRVRTDATLLLNPKLLRFERVTGTEPAGSVVLEVAASHGESGRLAWVETYRATVRAEADTIPAAVRALDAAVDQVYRAVARDLRRQGEGA